MDITDIERDLRRIRLLALRVRAETPDRVAAEVHHAQGTPVIVDLRDEPC